MPITWLLNRHSPARLTVEWAAVAIMLFGFATWFLATHQIFSRDADFFKMPSALFGMMLVTVSFSVWILADLAARSGMQSARYQTGLLAVIIAVGLILRLAMFATEPALETDFYRYLWDGAVTANGYNPYRFSPVEIDEMPVPVPQFLQDLSYATGNVFERIGYPHLRTIYPPAAQAGFALAYWIEPFSLNAWRAICVAAECTSLALMLMLLHRLKLNSAWVSLYWWNPLIIKELVNSVHMEAILVPFLLAAVLFSLARSYALSMMSLAVAAGIKLWPVLLAPILLRRLWPNWKAVVACLVLAGSLLAVLAVPVLLVTLDGRSGFVAYATKWQTNGALFTALKTVFLPLAMIPGFDDLARSLPGDLAGSLARLTMAGTAVAIAIALALGRLRSDFDLVTRIGWAAAAVFLLSPAQYPWYVAWFAPFLPVLATTRLSKALLLAVALVSLYYVSFQFRAARSYWIFRDIIVWAIWLPVWALLAYQFHKEKARDPQAPR